MIHVSIWINLKKHYTEWNKLFTKVYLLSHLFEIPEPVKLIYGIRKQSSGGLWEQGKLIDYKEEWEYFPEWWKTSMSWFGNG